MQRNSALSLSYRWNEIKYLFDQEKSERRLLSTAEAFVEAFGAVRFRFVKLIYDQEGYDWVYLCILLTSLRLTLICHL